MGVLLHAAPDHGTVEHVQCDKQCPVLGIHDDADWMDSSVRRNTLGRNVGAMLENG